MHACLFARTSFVFEQIPDPPELKMQLSRSQEIVYAIK